MPAGATTSRTTGASAAHADNRGGILNDTTPLRPVISQDRSPTHECATLLPQ
jgi:hypothetical protein